MRRIVKVSILTFIMALLTIPIGVKAGNMENEKVILIDPGHGGFDGGAKSKNGVVEKDINMQISEKLKGSLEAKGYKVILTRDCDEGLESTGKTIREKKREDLKKRTELKKETKCDIFISIHQNMFPQGSCFGAQVWHASNDKSKSLAELIQDSLKEVVTDNNKRVAKPAGEAYLILRDGYDGASVLVECGFLSNPEEEEKLQTIEHQNAIVEGITQGVDKYFNFLGNN